jgi:hypothetical protein
VRDPLASVAIAMAASLVVLPVTWYHHAAALVPIGIALLSRRLSVRIWVVGAVVLADVAIGLPPPLRRGAALLLATPWLHRAVHNAADAQVRGAQ